MNVRIARDGVEIGECDWEDLEQLVNEGQVLTTDHFWYEGMDDWRLLDDLIGLEESEPKPSAPVPDYVAWDSDETVAPPPILRRPSIAAVATGCAVAAAAILALYLIVAFSAKRADTPFPAVDLKTNLERTDADLRNRATSELVAKLNKLPVVATAPSYTTYDSLSIMIPEPPAPLIVTIRGTENAVNPETHAAMSRTDFVVTADYRQDRWFFKYYRASGNDLVHGIVTEIERDDKYPIPPAIVSLLGLQVNSD